MIDQEMKLKINKACDLSSISVLPPPPARRSSAIWSDSEPPFLGKSQGSQHRPQISQQSYSQGISSQHRPQISQQSYSQGISSQHGMFSQFSQNSLEEILTNEQRTGSEEKENSGKNLPCMPMVSYPREESQMVLSRPSTSQLSKWSSAASADKSRLAGQKTEDIEHRILSMENSLNRFAMILDSLQTDIMQANKGTKEVLMEMEGIRQKLTANDNILQQMNKGLEDVKSNLEGSFKSIFDQVSQDLFQEKMKEISEAISASKGEVDVSLRVLETELCKAVAQQMQAIACNLKIHQQNKLTSIVVSPKAIACSMKIPQQKQLTPTVVSPKLIGTSSIMPVKKHWTPITVSPKPITSSSKMPKKTSTPIVISPEEISRHTTSKQMQPLKKSKVSPEICGKVKVGSWTSVKPEEATITYARRKNVNKQKRASSIELNKEWRIPIDSDEEINGGFSCLFAEKETENYSTAEVKKETDRILRRARQRKRKTRSIIILN